jgi:hypothetical protein
MREPGTMPDPEVGRSGRDFFNSLQQRGFDSVAICGPIFALPRSEIAFVEARRIDQ